MNTNVFFAFINKTLKMWLKIMGISLSSSEAETTEAISAALV